MTDFSVIIPEEAVVGEAAECVVFDHFIAAPNCIDKSFIWFAVAY